MVAIKGLVKLKKELFKIQGKLLTETKKVFNKNSDLLQTRMRQNYLQGGTTGSRLKKRSGRLAASVKPINARVIKGGLIAGIKLGTTYAGVHIGKRGTKTTIRSKSGGYLKIPLPAVQTGAGVSQPSEAYHVTDTYFTTSGVVENAFPKMSKKGNLILFGYKKYQKGAKAGQTHGKLIPLFVLKKSVTIPTRVDPLDLLRWVKPKIIRDMEKIKL